MEREYLLGLNHLDVGIETVCKEENIPGSELIQMRLLLAIAERLETLVEEVHSIDETLRWIANDRLRPLVETLKYGLQERR